MQREKLSAMMDGEVLDVELLNAISCDSTLQKRWESYHLIRDTLRNDTPDVINFDIAGKVAAALENEVVRINPQVVVESQPEPATWGAMPFWQKFVHGQVKSPKLVLQHVYPLLLSLGCSSIIKVIQRNR